jgi:hypothetical protein
MMDTIGVGKEILDFYHFITKDKPCITKQTVCYLIPN